MQAKVKTGVSSKRQGFGSRTALLLGIVTGIALTLLCEGLYLAYFVWYHHMFIFGVNKRGPILLSVFLAFICLGAVALINAIRRIGD
jgi:hypothetical protein